MYSCGPLHMDEQRQENQLEPTYSSSMPIREVTLKTCRKQWKIGKDGKRRSGISVLMARCDDDHDLSLRVFGLLSSSLLLFPQCFGWYALQPSYQPKRHGNNNKDEDNSLKTLNDKNHQVSSQKFKQLRIDIFNHVNVYSFRIVYVG